MFLEGNGAGVCLPRSASIHNLTCILQVCRQRKRCQGECSLKGTYTFRLVHGMGVAQLLVVRHLFSDTWWIIDAMLDKEFSWSCNFAFGSQRGFVRCIVLGLSSKIDGPSSGVCDILGATWCLRHR